MNLFIQAIKLSTENLPKGFLSSRPPNRLLQPHRRCAGFRRYCNQFFSITSDHNSGTMADVINNIREAVGVQRGFDTIPKCRSHLLKYQPKPEELPDRSMKDTFTTALLPLEVNMELQERYVWHRDTIRFGRLMEDLDSFAVWICHRLIHIPSLPEGIPLPYTFVTVYVDKVEFLNIKDVKIDKDIKFSGFISWTGRTSMEIIIYVHQAGLLIANALFMMVARNATNTGSAPINALKPANKLEESYWKKAQERQKSRKQKQKMSLLNTKPMKSEDSLIYDVFNLTNLNNQLNLNHTVLPKNSRWMSESCVMTTTECFPENRNTQNTLFGGYIMRYAVETSLTAASTYSKSRPVLKSISDISFLKPIQINSFLMMTSYVAYTTPSHMIVMTVATIRNVHTFEKQTTNAFYFTYKHTGQQPLDAILPYSYHETLWYLIGKRKMMEFEEQMNRNEKKNC